MIDWVFILIALHANSATLEQTHIPGGANECTAHAKAALNQLPFAYVDVQAALCINTATGRHIDFRPPHPLYGSHLLGREIPPEMQLECRVEGGCFLITYVELMDGLRSAHNAGRRSAMREEKQ